MATVLEAIGDRQKWHTITLEFQDTVTTYSETGTPNPFTDRRLNVTFTGPSSQTYIVPGYFAADGDAAETSATSGDKWHCKFTPDEIGNWNYSANFREGSNVAVTYPSSPTDGTAGDFDGDNGSFTIIASDKSSPDLRAKGRLQYDGTRYPKFAETGEAFIKVGPDSPEDFLGYSEFDGTVFTGTNYISSYPNHIVDWQSGDAEWQTNQGRGIVGAVNYLSGKGLNSFSFITMSRDFGDTKNVSPFVEAGNNTPVPSYLQYDVSKLAQWEILFEHATVKGMFLHFKTHEEENIAQLGGNAGITNNTERKLYYRELIARFGHHLALNWNVGEEAEGLPASASHSGTASVSEHIEVFQYISDLDSYNHPRVIHTKNSSTEQDAMYGALYGNLSEATGASIQSLTQFAPRDTKRIMENAEAAGQSWLISHDETGGGISDSQLFRQRKLYGVYFAGGYGAEMYVSGQDFTLADFRNGSLDTAWDYCRYAKEFMATIPFTSMDPDPASAFTGTEYLFRQSNVVYAQYIASASGTNEIDLGTSGDTFTVEWFDPRNGGSRQNGTVTSVTALGGDQNVGVPPSSTSSDWVVIVTNDSVSTIPVTGVTVSPATSNINISQSQQLTVAISPANATTQTGTWSSNNALVASVNSSGLVTGVSGGTATITFTADDTTNGTITDTADITVTSGTTGIVDIKVSFAAGTKSIVKYIGSTKIPN